MSNQSGVRIRLFRPLSFTVRRRHGSYVATTAVARLWKYDRVYPCNRTHVSSYNVSNAGWEIVGQIKKCTGIIFRVIIEDSFSMKLKNGYVVYSAPPPGSGLVLAYILRILDGLLPTPDAGIDAQRVVETFKFAFGLRSLLGDPNFRNISKVRRFLRADRESKP